MDYKKLSVEELAHYQDIYSKKEFLTVKEASIWLQVTPDIIRKYLRQGRIVGIKPFGCRLWRIDVPQTKKLFAQQTKKYIESRKNK